MNIQKFTRPARRILPLKYCGAVIVAAGNATRMKGIDKALTELEGMPVIQRSVKAFQDCEAIREIVVVTRSDLLVQVMGLCKNYNKVRAVVAGGEDRPASVNAGLNALSGKVKLVAIHDGARPLVSFAVIDRTVRAANTYGAAAPIVPVKDTIKNIQGGMALSTPDRSKLGAVQTPQVFDFDLLRGALKKAKQDGLSITDDCSAVEHLGMKIKLVEGDERNIKITTPLDLKLAKVFLEDML